MIPGLGMWELIIILVIVFIIFGGSRLPELGSGIGRAILNFKKSISPPSEIDVTPKKKVDSDSSEEKATKKKIVEGETDEENIENQGKKA